MKKIIKALIPILFLPLILSFSGCDELNKLPLNIPVEFKFNTSGNNSTIVDNVSFCLSNTQEYADNQNKINSVKFLTAAYQTTSISSPDLNGDIEITLKKQNGDLLFTTVISNVKPAAFINNPIVLQLTQAQIQLLNSYFALLTNNKDFCFDATLSLINITGSVAPYQLSGYVEMVLEAEVEL